MPKHRDVLSVLLSALLAVSLAACGGGHGAARSAASSKPLVEAGRPPYITGLAVDPADGSVLLATNVGLYSIPPSGREARPISSRASENGANGPYGERVSSLAFDGPTRLLGSGHPDRVLGHLPPFLGLMESRDAGHSWTGIARTGLSDLHVLLVSNGVIYAFDTILGGVIVSSDGGRTFVERSAPEGPTVLDLAVDPKDGRYILASTPQAIFASGDQGETWHRLTGAVEARLTWTPSGLLRADADGAVLGSSDRGRHWTQLGRLAGTPGKLVTAAGGRLYAALTDARVETSSDGGREWKVLFSP